MRSSVAASSWKTCSGLGLGLGLGSGSGLESGLGLGVGLGLGLEQLKDLVQRLAQVRVELAHLEM